MKYGKDPMHHNDICPIGNCNDAVDRRLRGANVCTRHARLVWAAVELTRPVSRKAPMKNDMGTIYIVQLGDRVKIGFTLNMKRRMGQVPHERVLATFPGTLADEAAMHEAFAESRVTGEWFAVSPELLKMTRLIREGIVVFHA